jgi:hypothetical protein
MFYVDICIYNFYYNYFIIKMLLLYFKKQMFEITMEVPLQHLH